MTEKKSKITKTITFRLDGDKVDKINELADERGMSLREYILTQLDPNSEMGTLLLVEREKIVLSNSYAVKSAIDFISGLASIKEKNNLSEEQFSSAIAKSFEELIKNKME